MEEQRDPFDLTEVLVRIWDWKWPIAIVGFLSVLLAFGATRLVRPQYESFAILYPSATNSRDKLLDEFTFGFDVHAERLIQLIESTPIRDSIVKEFNLVKRYEVDKGKRGWEDRVSRMYFSNIRATKTRYKSVSIVARDFNPDTAAAIANEISRLVNVVNSNILKTSAQEQLDNINAAYREKFNLIESKYDSLYKIKLEARGNAEAKLFREFSQSRQSGNRWRDSLEALRSRYQVHDLGGQISVINQQLANAQSNLLDAEGKLSVLEASPNPNDSLVLAFRGQVNGARKQVDYFSGKLDELTRVSSKYSKFRDLYLEFASSGNSLQESYQNLVSSMNPEVGDLRVDRLKSDIDFELLQLNQIKENYQRALTNFQDPLPVAYLISEARPSWQKVSPNTKAIVIIAGLLGVLMTYIVLIVRNRIKERES